MPNAPLLRVRSRPRAELAPAARAGNEPAGNRGGPGREKPVT
jgi:hypothetical protein